jgi:uncharacterized membrane protein
MWHNSTGIATLYFLVTKIIRVCNDLFSFKKNKNGVYWILNKIMNFKLSNSINDLLFC